MNQTLQAVPQSLVTTPPTLWGLSVIQLHDRYWASRAVQVVRPQTPIPQSAKTPEIYLLLESDTAVLLSFDRLSDWLLWAQPALFWIRLRDPRHVSAPGSQTPATNPISNRRPIRVALTSSIQIAQTWSRTIPGPGQWKQLRASATGTQMGIWAWGRGFNGASTEQCEDLAMTMLNSWRWPDLTVDGLRQDHAGVWYDQSTQVDKAAKVKGPTWIGAHRKLGPTESIEKPTILWDNTPA